MPASSSCSIVNTSLILGEPANQRKTMSEGIKERAEGQKEHSASEGQNDKERKQSRRANLMRRFSFLQQQQQAQAQHQEQAQK